MEKEKNNIARKLLNPFKGDKAIWFIFIVLAIISLVSVFSSIGYEAETTSRTVGKAFVRHLEFVLLSFFVVVFISNFNYRRFAPASWIGYLLSIALLVAVLVFGHKETAAGSGMNRWLELPLLGSFQPSEFAKIVLIVYLSRLLAQNKEHLKEWPVFRNIVIAVLVIIGLIFAENLSTAVIIFFVCFAMIRISPITANHWRLTILALVAFGLIAIFLGNQLHIPHLERSGTWTSRIDNWLHFDEDKLTQESMARMAVATGKFFGVGVGSTIQARLMTQANNDMIYSIIVEETGMLGGTIVFLLYLFLYIRCIKIAWGCKGDFGRMTVVGLGTLIFFQAGIHMCVSVGALPVTGQTLPFISSGGSSYLCMAMALGVIQAVAYDVKKNESKKEQNTNESNN
ncbi:MAG: FtsW/RodA/SpoVE family cell cycle protein [Bacteroidales bacterium]|nr:FtsW/RodA/SpoVE family cell cycle protein [Bacteroidales bacterium]